MKTASRIVGTAALLDGFTVQDSPVYGAERRGAPLTAYVRISQGPILERGAIRAPNLLVVADDTLLDDPGVQPLAGAPPEAGLLIASVHPAREVREHTGHGGPMVARDFVALALEHTGSAAGLSTALASAACALLGLSGEAAGQAFEEELAALGLAPERVRASLGLAQAARAGVGRLELPPSAAVGLGAGSPVVEVRYVPAERGAPTVRAEPNTPLRRTGNWRIFRPVIDLARCTRCWVCFVRCPEGAIELDAEDTPRVDYAVCKGCLICVEECPIKAIGKAREVRQWASSEAAV